MADNETEETKPAEEAAAATESAASTSSSEPASTSEPASDAATEPAGDEVGMTADQSFAYWLTMLPFIGIALVFLFEFSKNTGDMAKLMNAGGALVVGIFAASFVNALTSEKKDEGAMEEAKPEGSS